MINGLSNWRYLPRWAVLLFDIGLVGLGFILTHINIEFTSHEWYNTLNIEQRFIVVIAIYLSFFLIFKTYHGVVRHSTFLDIFRLSLVIICSTGSLLFLNYAWLFFLGEKIFLIPFLAINMVFNLGLLLFFRITVKGIYGTLVQTKSKSSKNVLIVGVSDDSVAIAESLINTNSHLYQFKGFIAFGKKRLGYRILGKKVFHFSYGNPTPSLPEDINCVLFLNPNYSDEKIGELINYCIDSGIEILKTEGIFNFNSSSTIEDKVRSVEIEDLLPRDIIQLDDFKLKESINGSSILVTGGAGSIGSEIVRQLLKYSPEHILVVDQAETALHELEIELWDYADRLHCQVANICDRTHMDSLLAQYKVSTIYHAAAYKHVPLMERNPIVAAEVNTLGTISLAELAVEHQVDRFIFVSTDKAVNPTNVMGATKRAAEIYLHALQDTSNVKTKFITTRFGNVLGSNGSVIPHFKKQIAKKGPVTVTHKDIIRYFMTIPEACQLVLQAGAMGKGGEVFVFDMGEPVKILDLAIKMIKLSGFKPYEEIDITFTGLRPGEKLYEELLSTSSHVLPTYHDKICIAKVPTYSYDHLVNFHIELGILVRGRNEVSIVSLLKEYIPEFKSNNSVYQLLDK